MFLKIYILAVSAYPYFLKIAVSVPVSAYRVSVILSVESTIAALHARPPETTFLRPVQHHRDLVPHPGQDFSTSVDLVPGSHGDRRRRRARLVFCSSRFLPPRWVRPPRPVRVPSAIGHGPSRTGLNMLGLFTRRGLLFPAPSLCIWFGC